MTWAKVDDKLFSHPKWLATSKPGKALWVSALSWCAGQGTDGHVPTHVLPMLGATKGDARALVTSGLWEAADGGYQFHDWVEYQPDAASTKARRAAESEGGKRGMHTRWHTKRRTKVPGCQWCEDGSDGQSSDGVPDKDPYKGDGYGPNTPDPHPARTRIPTTGSRPAAPPVTRGDEPPPDFDQPEFDPKKILAGAGLAQSEVRSFLVDLKANNTRNTTALINALHRDGKLPRRIAEWRDERDLATEASARPKTGKRTNEDRVHDGLRLAAELAAESGNNVVHFPQLTEGA